MFFFLTISKKKIQIQCPCPSHRSRKNRVRAIASTKKVLHEFAQTENDSFTEEDLAGIGITDPSELIWVCDACHLEKHQPFTDCPNNKKRKIEFKGGRIQLSLDDAFLGLSQAAQSLQIDQPQPDDQPQVNHSQPNQPAQPTHELQTESDTDAQQLPTVSGEWEISQSEDISEYSNAYFYAVIRPLLSENGNYKHSRLVVLCMRHFLPIYPLHVSNFSPRIWKSSGRSFWTNILRHLSRSC